MTKPPLHDRILGSGLLSALVAGAGFYDGWRYFNGVDDAGLVWILCVGLAMFMVGPISRMKRYQALREKWDAHDRPPARPKLKRRIPR